MAQLNFGTGNSVTFGTTLGGSATATFNKTDISNIQIGDLLVAWIHDQLPDTGTITAPTGWTRYGAALGAPSYSASRLSGFYYYPVKVQADIDAIPASVTWTFSSSNGRVACVVSRATGVNLDHIEDVYSSSFTNGSAGTSFTIPGIITNNPTTLVIGGLAHQNSANTTVPSTTGFMTAFQEYKTTQAGSTDANTGAAMGYQEQSTAGSTGDITATFDLSVTNANGEIVAFTTGTYQAPGTITRPVIMGTPTTTLLQTAATSFSIAVPTGLQDGDVLIMAVSAQTPTATSDFTSSGWSRISQPFVASSAGYRNIGFYAYPVPRAVTMTATSFTFTSTDSASGGRIVAEMFIVRGADISHLVTAISPYGASAAKVLTVTPAAPSANYNLLLVAYNAQFTGSIDYSIASGPSGMTQQANMTSTTTTASSKTILAVYQQNIESGALASKSLTWNGSNTQNSGVSVSLRGLSAAITNNGIALQYTSSTDVLSNAHLFYTSDTDTLATPLEVRPVPQGYSSVTNMLATNPIYVAHRGGSGNWPEMSLQGYTQSAFWGVKALEVSLARTSDGVWFGLHDATLDRTSGTTNFIAANHTWAEVQQYLITSSGTTDTTQAAQPYMRWEDLMTAYYTSHVIFVDPKVASAYTTELLSMMDAMPGTPTDRFVGKYYGPTTSWGDQARSHGYKTWGYYYQADVPTLASTQASWDILGMDYTADQPSWTAALSYGKPVLGHIVSTSAGATTAFNYGAVGVMVSGVIATIPRSV